MKNIFLIAITTIIFLSISNNANAQEYEYKYKLVKKANGVGPAWIIDYEDIKHPSDHLANQHDIDYGTLGMSKSEADQKFYNALESEGYTSAGIFLIKRALNNLGDTPYNDAQQMARDTQKYKAEAEKALNMTIDTYRYHIVRTKMFKMD